MIEILEKIKSGIIAEVTTYSIIILIAALMLVLLLYLKRSDRLKCDSDKKSTDKTARKPFRVTYGFFAIIALVIIVCFFIDRIDRIGNISDDIEKNSFVSIEGEFSYSGEIDGRGYIKYTDNSGDEKRLTIISEIFPDELDHIKDDRKFSGEITYSERSGYVTAISFKDVTAETGESD